MDWKVFKSSNERAIYQPVWATPGQTVINAIFLFLSGIDTKSRHSFFQIPAIVNARYFLCNIRRSLVTIALTLFVLASVGQIKRPEDFGFRHLKTIYKGDTVDILVKSKKGDETKSKPLFLFCQGSLPQPLIKYDEKGMFGVFPFNPEILENDYHLVIVAKPYIAVIAHLDMLGKDFTIVEKSGRFPLAYTQRNFLDYYVYRNIHVIQFLQKKHWVSKASTVVAGHSEGSTIAAKMASTFPKITHLIYSGGNPLGRILTIIERSRTTETDSTLEAEKQFDYWENVTRHPGSLNSSGDTYKATYDFSIPPIRYLLKLKIPVLVSYGTKDAGSPFNDYLRVETIRQNKRNFNYKAYIGTEHNYFPVKKNGDTDYETFNWDRVVGDWKKWLSKKNRME